MTIKEEIRMLIDEEVERFPERYDVSLIDKEFEKADHLKEMNKVIELTMHIKGGINELLNKTSITYFK